jgi:5'(3')-deoxyribonucleotidase
MKTIGIDVDLVVCDPVDKWFDYMNKITGRYNKEKFFAENKVIDYNLGSYFPELSKQESMHFWSCEIYDEIKPFQDAVEVINKLAKKNKIAFISYCKQGHFGNKVDCLKKWFNISHEHWSFYATKQKSGVRVDCMIDDRNSNLNQFHGQDEVIKIKFDTPYSQCEELKISLDLCTDNWYSIGEFLDGML